MFAQTLREQGQIDPELQMQWRQHLDLDSSVTDLIDAEERDRFEADRQAYGQAIAQIYHTQERVDISTLQNLQSHWGLGAAVTSPVDAGVLSEVEQKQWTYLQAYCEATHRHFRVDETTRTHLDRLRQQLGLSEAVVKRCVERYYQCLKQYETTVKTLIYQYDLSENQPLRLALHETQQLERLQQEGLLPADVEATQAEVERHYRQRLEEYIDHFRTGLYQQEPDQPLDPELDQFLHQFQQEHELSPEVVTAIHARIQTTYRQVVTEYMTRLRHSLQRSYPLSDRDRQDLQTLRERLHLDEAIAAQLETRLQDEHLQAFAQRFAPPTSDVVSNPTAPSIEASPETSTQDASETFSKPVDPAPTPRSKLFLWLALGLTSLAGAAGLVGTVVTAQWPNEPSATPVLRLERLSPMLTQQNHQSWLAIAQRLSEQNQPDSLVQAIQFAELVPQQSALYSEAQQLIQQCSASVQQLAQQQYDSTAAAPTLDAVAPRIEQAIAILNKLPNASQLQQASLWQSDLQTLAQLQQAIQQRNRNTAGNLSQPLRARSVPYLNLVTAALQRLEPPPREPSRPQPLSRPQSASQPRTESSRRNPSRPTSSRPNASRRNPPRPNPLRRVPQRQNPSGPAPWGEKPF